MRVYNVCAEFTFLKATGIHLNFTYKVNQGLIVGHSTHANLVCGTVTC